MPHPAPTVFLRTLLAMGLVALLSACSLTGDGDEEEVKPAEAVEVLYNRARDYMAERNYKKAAADFEEVEQQHPYSEWAVRSQVMAGYASYKAGDYDTAAGTLERFVKMHPTHDSVPYAYYIMALCYYEQISDVGRDQKITEIARQALGDVVSRFPDTEYARDAKLKLDLVTDHLAGKEMDVGRYYLSRQEFLAAINRFRVVVEVYQTTGHIPEALHRLVECYLKLGVEEEAKKYAAVLGHNYPHSQWYRDSYALLNGRQPDESEDGGFFRRWLPKL